MSSPRIDSCDVSQKQKELLEWRHAKRQELRYKYLKEMLNPMKQTNITDTAVERYAMLRIKHEYATRMFKGRELYIVMGFFGIMYLIHNHMFSHKEKEERELRSGKVGYRERYFRFS
ncbi:unnamed protein product [Xylocopa violacea]|uniref:NADH dehydrogenase [ubiquinone] 1 beta subcomplex subunit 4 n=1 Tax=Xylocopa violacea TaxID=135666 RepID=A0ABP1PK42_XYLVO